MKEHETEHEIDKDLVEFHHAFVDALDDFIIQSVEVAEKEFDVEASDAFSMMASRMLFVVVRGAIKGGSTKESFLDIIGNVYDMTKLALSEPEGGLQ